MVPHCSLSCVRTATYRNVPSEHSGLKKLIKLAQKRCKKTGREINLSLDHLVDVWKEQEEICRYSGVKLKLSRWNESRQDPRYLASLDRIDSNVGYIDGNVQIISLCMNYMKSTLTHKETIEFIQLIKDS